MQTTLVVHIVAGSLGLVSGFVALYSSKGAPLHRRAGRAFVAVMLTMCLTGIAIAAIRGKAPGLNIPAGVLTAYLVTTGFVAVRPPGRGSRVLNVAAMLVGLGVGLLCLAFGVEAIAGGGTRKGMPAFPFFMFGVVGTLAGVSDVRMIREGGVRAAVRLRRHLWRMCFALFIAAMSFFLGQADVIPKPIRVPPLLALPPLAVLATMIYWLRRVRARRAPRGTVVIDGPEPA